MTLSTYSLLCDIDELFFPNEESYTDHEQPILIEKICKGNAARSTSEFVLGWAIDTIQKVLKLPLDQRDKLTFFLDSVTLDALRFSRRQ